MYLLRSLQMGHTSLQLTRKTQFYEKKTISIFLEVRKWPICAKNSLCLMNKLKMKNEKIIFLNVQLYI